MGIRVVMALVLAGSVATIACGGGAPSNEAQPAAAPAAPADASRTERAAERVFFMQPASGATVKSPVQFVFGSEGFTLAAVPAGEVKEVRAGTGHFHLGVDTDCLPVGQIIPKAAPWIHFGDGKNMIEMQLAPGPHKFAVQAGDDLHQTMAGLCETISITVAG
jgi:hypothetical protein